MSNEQNGDSQGPLSPEVKDAVEKLNPPQMVKEQVAFGFDPEGWMILKVHESQGVLRILGLLEQCKDMVKVHYVQKAEQKRAGALINPGRFNPFKKKMN